MKRPVGIVLSCEHASADVPPGLDLGVGPTDLLSHCSWDPGAALVTKIVGARIGNYPFLGLYSRLVADLNRAPESRDVIAASSFGLEVPGNRDLTSEERTERLRLFHTPYRSAVRKRAEDILERGELCLHVSVHSFVPEYEGKRRPTVVGVLFDPDHPLEPWFADRFLAALRDDGIEARPNDPYPGTADGLTTTLRTELPPDAYVGIEIELRQDVLEIEAECARLAALLEEAIRRSNDG